MLDHWYNASGEAIMPTLYGEALGLINKSARLYVQGVSKYPNPIELLRDFYKEFPVENGKEDKSKELEEMIVQKGVIFFFDWFKECIQYWRTSEVLKSLHYS